MRNGDWRRVHKTDRYATRARGKAEQATRSARPRVSRGVGGDAAGRVYAPHVVEPTFSGLLRWRRPVRDYERLPACGVHLFDRASFRRRSCTRG
jgi:hypothetical protein